MKCRSGMLLVLCVAYMSMGAALPGKAAGNDPPVQDGVEVAMQAGVTGVNQQEPASLALRLEVRQHIEVIGILVIIGLA